MGHKVTATNVRLLPHETRRLRPACLRAGTPGTRDEPHNHNIDIDDPFQVAGLPAGVFDTNLINLFRVVHSDSCLAVGLMKV